MTTGMRRLVCGAMSIAALGAAAGAATVMGAGATATKVTAKLTAAKEVPAPTGSPTGTGTFTGTIGAKRVLNWKLTFTGLTSATAGAHIHIGKKGKTGPVAIVLCGTTCSSPKTGRVTLTVAQAKSIKAGGAYVNVHTTTNPSGEIRGQIAIKK